MRRIGALGISVLIVQPLLGCVSNERQAVVAAREAHEKCVAEHSATHPSCEVLRERYLDTQRRYEDASRRAWGCDPAQEECPPRR